MSPSTQRIIGLDVLRCAAIFGVLVAHGLIFLYPHVGPIEIGGATFLIGYLGHLGYYGVELFFVLSGFLIGRILLRSGEDLRRPRELFRFWTRRWFRTLPAYFLFLLLNLAVVLWVFPQVVPWDRLLSYTIFTQTFASYDVFFFPESWSLAVEEWFYLLFPAALFGLFRARLSTSAAFLAAGVGFAVFSTWMRWQISTEASVNWAVEPRVVTLARFDALMMGIFAAWWSLHGAVSFRRLRLPLAVIGLALLGYAYATLFAPEDAYPRWFTHVLRFNLVSVGFACLLPWGQHFQSLGTPALDTATRHLAYWSYSMYLSHMLVLRFLAERWLPGFAENAVQGWLGLGLFWVVTIGISALVYRGFEHPLTTLRDRFDFSRDR
jgi:peptidoglycan/LPS O-acetylase OafA/YrhL